MIEKPASPHNLIGDHWPEIDELGIAKVATALANAGTGAATAEQKSYQDGGAYQALLPEGFETQVEAAFKVGGMAADLSGWFTKCATETGVVAEGVALGKLLIAVTTMVAEAVIASKEAEILLLQLMSLRPEVRAQRIQQLRSEIKQITDDAKQAIQEMYDGIYTPSAPVAPGLQPLVNNAPFGQKFSYGNVVPAGTGHGDVPATPLGNGSGETQGGKPASTQEGAQGTKSGPGSSDEANQGLKADSSSSQTQGEKAGSSPNGSNSELSNATQGAKPGSSPTLDVQPAGATSSAPSVTAPAASSGPSASSLSSVGSSMPKMPSAPSAPSGGGLGGGSGLSGLGSGGGAAASPASPPLNPAQQFLNGAAQGFSQSPVATGASAATAAAQPFRPPAGSTMQTSPAPLAPTAPAAASPSAPAAAPQQVVTSSPSAPVAAGTPPIAAGAGGVPLAPPPTAGVPNAAPPPSPVAPSPAAAAPPPGGGGGPVSGPPPGILNLGGKNAALKAVQMGAHSVGEGLRSTPEFNTAMALVAALNAPRPVVTLGGWSCAVFGAGVSTRFVVAERHGLSWIPAGMFLPAGLTVAHLDERVPADVRYSWRGLDPSALVLAEYAKAIGEQPRIVVARAYHPGMPGWFGRGVVLAADEGSHPIINNPLDEMGGPYNGRHRLQVADPGSWQFVMSLKTDKEVADEVRAVAQWLVTRHDQIFEQWPEADADAKLRAAALAQLGREDGTEEIKALLAAKMTDLATRLIGTPNYGTPQWRVHTGTEMALRGWEALLLGLGKPTHLVLADMQYAVLMATQPILPMPAEAAAAGA